MPAISPLMLNEFRTSPLARGRIVRS